MPDFSTLRRILYPERLFSARQAAALTDELNRLTVLALNCDLGSSMPNDRRSLLDSVERGGYHFTHVGLALIFMRTLGCESPFPHPDRSIDNVTAGMAAFLAVVAVGRNCTTTTTSKFAGIVAISNDASRSSVPLFELTDQGDLMSSLLMTPNFGSVLKQTRKHLLLQLARGVDLDPAPGPPLRSACSSAA